MSFSELDSQADDAFSEINMTPLVDVMLVLLIIFMVTMPVLTQAVKVDLPEANALAMPTALESISLSVDATGQWFWNKHALTDVELKQKLAGYRQQPQTQLNIYADQKVPYDRVATLLAAIQQAGLSKVALALTPQS